MIDIATLCEKAKQALQTGSRGVASGWSPSGGNGTSYKGATFDLDGRWVVVRGPQRPASAQLLDSTAWLMHATEATHGLALLDPEEVSTPHDDAPSSFRRRYQAAVYHGLGIVSVETAGDGACAWERGVAPQNSRSLDDVADRVRKDIERHRASEAWSQVVEAGKSPLAEPLVRAVIGLALGPEFREAPRNERKFRALWRSAEADGLWRGGEAFPRTVALEVKVTEDTGAPFSQAFDDLGEFDAVLCVRLRSQKTRKDIDRRSGLDALKADVQTRVPIRYIDVDF